jgi:Na+(H+)/acetate symporter ActP
MTTVLRSTRRSSYPALMLFGLVYLMAFAIVISPETFRADRVMMDDLPAASTTSPKETP